MNFASVLIIMACEVSVFSKDYINFFFSVNRHSQQMTDNWRVLCISHSFYHILFNFFFLLFLPHFHCIELAVLVLYLTGKLAYTKDDATVLFHVFTSLAYFFPLIGAIVADSWLGRFK